MVAYVVLMIVSLRRSSQIRQRGMLLSEWPTPVLDEESTVYATCCMLFATTDPNNPMRSVAFILQSRATSPSLGCLTMRNQSSTGCSNRHVPVAYKGRRATAQTYIHNIAAPETSFYIERHCILLTAPLALTATDRSLVISKAELRTGHQLPSL